MLYEINSSVYRRFSHDDSCLLAVSANLPKAYTDRATYVGMEISGQPNSLRRFMKIK